MLTSTVEELVSSKLAGLSNSTTVSNKTLQHGLQQFLTRWQLAKSMDLQRQLPTQTIVSPQRPVSNER
jgi:hypothetical protein